MNPDAQEFNEIVALGECDAKWNAFVEGHPKGTIFHTAGFLRSCDATPKHVSLALAAIDGNGDVMAILPAVKVSTLSGIASRMASRSIWYAEPICVASRQGEQALERLIGKHDQVARSCLFTEVRAIDRPGIEQQVLRRSGYEYLDYLNYVVDTTPSPQEMFNRLSKSVRNKIRRSENRGVAIEIDNSDRGVRRMYALVRESYQRSGVPLADEALFHNALSEMREAVQIRIATYRGHDVAGGIGLVYADRFYAWYGGSLREAGIVPFDCLTWSEIEWAGENGLRKYDFGGAGWPDEDYGPREFKKKFGGELVRFGRYRKVASPLKLRFAESAFRIARRMISK